MLPVEQIIVDETGQDKASAIFNAQWYPDVAAYVKQTGTGLTLSVKLQGSVNGSDWNDVGSALTANGVLHNFDGTKRVYYPLYRIYITTNSGNEGFKLNAWICAGGA